MSNLPKLLIIGHARHGKDTVAEILSKQHGYKFISSSVFVGKEVMWDNWGVAVYPNFEAMFEDRVNHRKLWGEMISAYNTPDKTKTGRTMIERGYDMYVGMRREDEIIACIGAKIFDHIIWVDRSHFLPPEPYESMQIPQHYATDVIDNNGSLALLPRKVAQFHERITRGSNP